MDDAESMIGNYSVSAFVTAARVLSAKRNARAVDHLVVLRARSAGYRMSTPNGSSHLASGSASATA